MNGDIILVILVGLISIAFGFAMGRYALQKLFKNLEQEAKLKSDLIIKQAETFKDNKIIDAKEKILKLKSNFEGEVLKKKNKIVDTEERIKQKESELQGKESKVRRKETEFETRIKQKESELQGKESKIRRKETESEERIKQKESELQGAQSKANRKEVELESLKKNIQDQQIKALEKISTLTANQVKEQLVEILKDEAKTEASSYAKDIVEEAKLTATKESKKIIIQTIQRTAAEHTIENSVSVFNIENDDVKGKIIGREGRNIRALEAATGVEIIVDDTPGAIIISCFDPVRREIASLSLHRLVKDGRIHPARVEEVVKKTTKNIEDEIGEAGERTTIDLGVHGLHPELIKMVGRMRFRSSYGQNLLQHSREVANLCGTMAAELKLNAKRAKRAGLLHDIGKVYPENSDLPHAILGMELAEKYKEHPEVANAIGAHHDEIEMTNMISPITQACDAISASRPGARREMTENYIKRLKDLEKFGADFEGVDKCYAIQAGRELRVLVDASSVTDEKASQLSFDISQKIEKNMQYPGQIKVTVIREMRSVAFAK